MLRHICAHNTVNYIKWHIDSGRVYMCIRSKIIKADGPRRAFKRFHHPPGSSVINTRASRCLRIKSEISLSLSFRSAIRETSPKPITHEGQENAISHPIIKKKSAIYSGVLLRRRWWSILTVEMWRLREPHRYFPTTTTSTRRPELRLGLRDDQRDDYQRD